MFGDTIDYEIHLANLLYNKYTKKIEMTQPIDNIIQIIHRI